MIHVTLQTGHARESPRSEVGEDVIARLRGTILAALGSRGRHVPLGAPPGYTLTAAAERDNLIVTIWTDDAPVATVGVSLSGGAELWRLMHRDTASGPLATAGAPAPSAPWVASRLDAGIVLHTDAAEWLGDAARCIAWAWADYRGGAS